VPVETFVDTNSDLLTLTVTGAVSAEEMLKSIRRIFTDPSFHPGMKVLTDMREALHAADGEEVRRVAQLLIANMDKMAGVKNAVVVRQEATYGIMRTLQLQTDGFPFETALFYDLDEAQQWLAQEVQTG